MLCNRSFIIIISWTYTTKIGVIKTNFSPKFTKYRLAAGFHPDPLEKLKRSPRSQTVAGKRREWRRRRKREKRKIGRREEKEGREGETAHPQSFQRTAHMQAIKIVNARRISSPVGLGYYCIGRRIYRPHTKVNKIRWKVQAKWS